MDCNTNFLSVQYLNSTKVVLITFQKPPMFHFIRRVMHIKQTKIPTLCFNMSFLGLLNYHYNKHIVKNNIYTSMNIVAELISPSRVCNTIALHIFPTHSALLVYRPFSLSPTIRATGVCKT